MYLCRLECDICAQPEVRDWSTAEFQRATVYFSDSQVAQILIRIYILMMMNRLPKEKLICSVFGFIILTACMGKHTTSIPLPCAQVKLESHWKIRSQHHSISHSHLYNLLILNTCFLKRWVFFNVIAEGFYSSLYFLSDFFFKWRLLPFISSMPSLMYLRSSRSFLLFFILAFSHFLLSMTVYLYPHLIVCHSLLICGR